MAVGPTLWEALDTSFGYLNQKGYCDKRGKCHQFPVAIGEFGSRFADKDVSTGARGVGGGWGGRGGAPLGCIGNGRDGGRPPAAR